MPSENVAAQDTEKRDAILDQAIAVFAQEGFQNSDVQVIADRAGVGKGTVYRYFGNKEDLFWAATFAVLQRMEQHLLRAMEGLNGAYARLRAASVAYADFFQSNPHYLEVVVQDRAMFRGSHPESHSAYHNALVDRFAALLEDGIAAGEFRPVDARKTIVSMSSALYGTVIFKSYMIDNFSLTERAEHVVGIFLEGIRALPVPEQREN